ncbi:type II toxin-antitoxin system RelE/ParE family toxin [Rhizobium sp. LjRoot254]
MSDHDVADLVSYLSQNPEAGEEMQGTGGCRKLRFAIRGNNKGKSGGVRVITFFSGVDLPVFLLTVFGKSQKVNLDKAERNGLKIITEQIVQTYSRRVERLKPGAKT